MNFDYTNLQKIRMNLLKCDEMINELLSSEIFYNEDYNDDQKEKIVVYSTTSNTFGMLRASLKSLFYNADIDKVILITDTDSLPSDFPKDIELISYNEPPSFLEKSGENMDTKYTYFCLLRTAFHKIFDNINKVLSLDYDTIIRKNISELWDINLGSRYYIAGVLEARRAKLSLYGYNPNSGFIAQSEPSFKSVDYMNSGVMLMNLKKLRDDGTGDKMIDMINETKFTFPEQDVINAVCHRHIYPLHTMYNTMNFVDSCENPKIMHMAASEKKLENPEVNKYKNMDWELIRKRRRDMFDKDLSI